MIKLARESVSRKGCRVTLNISTRNLRVSDLQFHPPPLPLFLAPRHPLSSSLFPFRPVSFSFTNQRDVTKSRSFILCLESLLGFHGRLPKGIHLLDRVSRLEPRCRASRNTMCYSERADKLLSEIYAVITIGALAYAYYYTKRRITCFGNTERKREREIFPRNNVIIP